MQYFATENAVTTEDKSGDAAWVAITAEQYTQAIDALASGLEVVVDGGFLIRQKQPSPDHQWQNGEWVYIQPPVEPPPEPEPRLVRKAIIIDRLYAAGKLEAADEILKSMSLYDRQRWEVRDAVYFNDPTLVAALNAIGADPDVILAPEA